MDDKELLELAAKAVGAEWCDEEGTFYLTPGNEWNPRSNSGDCADMETELWIDLTWLPGSVLAQSSIYASSCAMERFSSHNGDKKAARRAASVRCAAMVGKAMQSTAPESARQEGGA